MDEIDVREKLKSLPERSGVYLMKDQKGAVIYVGKARSLKDRVRSYFQKGASLSPRIESLVQNIGDIEWMVTESDLEALILENNLIKKHKPRYNVILRDDKNYPFLRLYVEDKFPRIEVVRRIRQDGALYFGPYVPVNAMRDTLKVIKRVFPLATCKIDLDRKYERPCIEYEIGRCAGPCVGAISEEGYKKVARDVRLFLEGKDRELLRSMKRKMYEEAERLNFEEAARIRDRISRIEKVLERQRVVSAELKDVDVIGLAREGEIVDLQVLFFRRGMLVGRKDIFYEKAGDISDEEILLSFIEQFYSRDVLIPSEILLPVGISGETSISYKLIKDDENNPPKSPFKKGGLSSPPLEKGGKGGFEKEFSNEKIIEKWLTEKRGGTVSITVPGRGKKLGMLRLAMENAQEAIKGHGRKVEEKERGVEELQQMLSLSVVPERIEAFDISNIFGAEAVGSLVVWEGGKFRKDEYRHYKIRTVVGADDFAMMREVVHRRYSRMIAEGLEPPDLIIIDGGKGQLNAAMAALEGLGIRDIGIIGLAKAKEEKEERIFLPERHDAIGLDIRSPATHLLQHIRDEAHRFAISHHRKLRGKEAMLSELDNIEGIGRARKLALLKYFGSVEALKGASIKELAKAPKMTKKVAEELYEVLRKTGG